MGSIFTLIGSFTILCGYKYLPQEIPISTSTISSISNYLNLFRDRSVVLLLIVQGLIRLFMSVIMTFIPLWFVASKAYGGFLLLPFNMGLIMGISGILSLLCQILFTRKIISYLGSRITSICCCFVLAGIVLFGPLISRCNDKYSDIVLIVILTCFMCSILTIFTILMTAVSVMINNSVFPEERHWMNSMVQSVINIVQIPISFFPLLFFSI